MSQNLLKVLLDDDDIKLVTKNIDTKGKFLVDHY